MSSEPSLSPESPFPRDVVAEFASAVPEGVVRLWQEDGSGATADGYLRVIDPRRYRALLLDAYPGHPGAVPVFATGLGDVIVFDDGYFVLLRFRRGLANIIGSDFEVLTMLVEDDDFLDEDLDWSAYPPAVEAYGPLAADECFGYVPLLGLGAPELVEDLQKVKTLEYIAIITQLMGPLVY